MSNRYLSLLCAALFAAAMVAITYLAHLKAAQVRMDRAVQEGRL